MNSRVSDTEGMGGMFDDASPVEEFFVPRPKRGRPATGRLPQEKPEHYKVVSISLYVQDIAHLEELVARLKKQGYTRANKSLVIREALRQLDLDAIPPQR